jgi:hypothetical protein
MELSAVDLMAFMLFSQIAIAAYLLYSFIDQEREGRRRTNTTLAHMERLFAEFEQRAASGAYRSAEELDRVISRNSPAAPSRSERQPAAASARPRLS